MTFNPRIAFGLAALPVALKAKVATVTDRDRLQIAAAAIWHVPEDAAAIAAVGDFLKAHRSDPLGAGEALMEFLTDYAAGASPRATEAALIEAQAAFFEWQKRADFQ